MTSSVHQFVRMISIILAAHVLNYTLEPSNLRAGVDVTLDKLLCWNCRTSLGNKSITDGDYLIILLSADWLTIVSIGCQQ